MEWLSEPLDDIVCSSLSHHLDPNSSGVVNIITVDDFAEPDGLRMSLREFIEEQSISSSQQSFLTPHSSAPKESPRTPLLVWIDDCPENNVEGVQWACWQGISVMQKVSAAEAKEWIDENIGIFASLIF